MKGAPARERARVGKGAEKVRATLTWLFSAYKMFGEMFLLLLKITLPCSLPSGQDLEVEIDTGISTF